MLQRGASYFPSSLETATRGVAETARDFHRDVCFFHVPSALVCSVAWCVRGSGAPRRSSVDVVDELEEWIISTPHCSSQVPLVFFVALNAWHSTIPH